MCVVVFILFPCFFPRIDCFLLKGRSWLSGSIIGLTLRRVRICKLTRTMFWRSEGPDGGPVNEVERALHGVDVTWNSRKAYPYPIGRGGRLAEEVQPAGLGCREDLDDGDGGNGDALVILNRVGELIDASEVGRRRINDVCARER